MVNTELALGPERDVPVDSGFTSSVWTLVPLVHLVPLVQLDLNEPCFNL